MGLLNSVAKLELTFHVEIVVLEPMRDTLKSKWS